MDNGHNVCWRMWWVLLKSAPGRSEAKGYPLHFYTEIEYSTGCANSCLNLNYFSMHRYSVSYEYVSVERDPEDGCWYGEYVPTNWICISKNKSLAKVLAAHLDNDVRNIVVSFCRPRSAKRKKLSADSKKLMHQKRFDVVVDDLPF